MITRQMQPTIKTIPEKKLIGKRITMNFIENKTSDLWRSFISRKNEIKNKVNTDLISMRVYDASYSFENFNPAETFDKWATLEVSNFDEVPADMEAYTLAGGLYAIFDYKGLNTDTHIFDYIYGVWLPNNSEYDLDTRPHFEVMGAKYKNNDPDSEEEMWIPIKLKK